MKPFFVCFGDEDEESCRGGGCVALGVGVVKYDGMWSLLGLASCSCSLMFLSFF